MAQSGHGWPAGQYHPDGPDHTGTAGSNDLGLSYGNEIDTDSEMMYMPDWGTMNQTAGSLAVQNHATAPSQQFYQPQSYYQANGGFAQASSAESRGDSASPAVPFGSGVFQDPTFQRSGHQQHQDQQAYQQFNNAGPNQHNVPATRSLSDNSWQTGHAPQNQYTQQTFSYGGHQPTYQQQIQSTSHSHAQTPPPGLRSAAHFAGTQIEQAIPQANASQTGSVNVQTHLHPQPPNQSAAQYQFQISQGQVRKSPYQNAAALGLPNPAPFQNPVRFAQPNHAVGHSNVSMSKPQGSTQQAIAAAVGSVSHLQKPVRTGSPATYPQQLAVAQSPGVSYANGHQTFAPIMAAGSTLQPQHDAVYVPTYVPSRPPFDPIAQGGFTKLGTYANLFLSDRPVESPILEIIPEDTFPFSAHFNGKDAALLPNRARRLPCEIRRDWKWLRKQEKGADSDAKRRAIVIERDRLDREMINVNGEHSKFTLEREETFCLHVKSVH